MPLVKMEDKPKIASLTKTNGSHGMVHECVDVRAHGVDNLPVRSPTPLR